MPVLMLEQSFKLGMTAFAINGNTAELVGTFAVMGTCLMCCLQADVMICVFMVQSKQRSEQIMQK